METQSEIDFDKTTGLLVVSFPYNADHVAKIKAIPKARFTNGEKRYWSVPLSHGKELLDSFPTFSIADETKQLILDWKAPDGRQYDGKITVSDDSLIIAFEYSPDLVSKVKSLPGARFDRAKKLWKVPFIQHEIAIKTLTNFEIAPEVGERIKGHEQLQAQDNALTTELIKQLDRPLPSGRTLFEHQKSGVRFLLEKRRTILADDMGLGKTTQALVAAQTYKIPVIVICPASLQINWQREAAMVGIEIAVYSWAKIPKPPTHDFVLIADEAHYAQSMKSQRTKSMLMLAKSEHCRGALLLTGTPIKNGRPVNLYPLLDATQHKLSHDKRGFEARYCDAKETRWSRWDTSGSSHLDELHTKTKDVILRRMKKDCLDLPEKTRVIRSVELSDKAQRVYNERLKELRDGYHQRIKEGKISDESEALVTLNHVRHAGSQAKTETAIELAQETIEQGNQVVVFVAFQEPGNVIASALGVNLFSGSTSKEERQAMVDRFQAGQDKAFVCTIGAGGVGITLTAAQTVILVDRPWTPGDAEQAEDRLHRIGQTNAVTSIWLQCGEIDEAIDEILQQKKERIDLVLQGKRKTMRGTGSAGAIAKELLPAIME